MKAAYKESANHVYVHVVEVDGDAAMVCGKNLLILSDYHKDETGIVREWTKVSEWYEVDGAVEVGAYHESKIGEFVGD